MKCVQIVGQGLPVRLSDEDARTIVDVDRDGQYCPKSVWKRFHVNDPVRPSHYITTTGRIARL